eukprot:TRINITY_DN2420_c1_g1_i1.p1 TRINITY_DN2420_c1_g1~~TRINITY_DN2420_c1_g1_i1.p1  ORF type:complete len:333 (-),score=52.81 TRINITY_DN2420_c1_g1_i1:141-1139(-)
MAPLGLVTVIAIHMSVLATGQEFIPSEEVNSNEDYPEYRCSDFDESTNCNADEKCKWCFTKDKDGGNCRSIDYNATTAAEGEDCDAIEVGCKALGTEVDACNTQAGCKKCTLREQNFTYCSEIDSEESAICETSSLSNSSLSLATNLAASGKWYRYHGRWHWYGPKRGRRHGQSRRRRHGNGRRRSVRARVASSRRRQHHQHHSAAGGGRVMTLYHQTSQAAGSAIIRGGFRPGKSGWCGGAIYFATSPRATESKAIAPSSQLGYMLRCQVAVGEVKRLNNRCGGVGAARSAGYTVVFNPGDGDEYVIWNSRQVRGCSGFPYRNHKFYHRVR